MRVESENEKGTKNKRQEEEDWLMSIGDDREREKIETLGCRKWWPFSRRVCVKNLDTFKLVSDRYKVCVV